MKTWKEKVNIPKFGICTVKEAENNECGWFNKYHGYIAPIDHGFVNLYHGDKWVGWCGVIFAERHIIKEKDFKYKK